MIRSIAHSSFVQCKCNVNVDASFCSASSQYTLKALNVLTPRAIGNVFRKRLLRVVTSYEFFL